MGEFVYRMGISKVSEHALCRACKHGRASAPMRRARYRFALIVCCARAIYITCVL